MTKLKDTDLYVRKIKYIWVAPLLKGEVKNDDMSDVMLALIFKIICDKDGNDSNEEDLDLDDFMAAQAYLLEKIKPQKKS
jgi:hypothetical protein